MNKKGYEFNFSWLFALIIGSAVLAFAIYAVVQIIDVKQLEEEATQAKQIGTLLDPIETNLESARFSRIIVSQPTIINNECLNTTGSEPFGRQRISTELLSKPSGKSSGVAGPASTFRNKYLFSPEKISAEKEFYVLSKPLKLPYKVADILILYSDETEYCFVDTLEGIKKDIRDLALKKT